MRLEDELFRRLRPNEQYLTNEVRRYWDVCDYHSGRKQCQWKSTG